nr:MAG TPA: hypothetical protein [Caudoviricetes sp.]
MYFCFLATRRKLPQRNGPVRPFENPLGKQER